jgi:methyl-accepting chemotaxis protein
VKKTADLVNQISGTSREQSQGSEQISKAVQQFDEVIQGNAQDAEAVAAMAKRLAEEASGLRSAASFFVYGGTTLPALTQDSGK